MIIGISGKIGSGKDYIAENFIVPWFRMKGVSAQTVAFADQIKINAAAQNDVSIDMMYNNKTTETRKMLQTAGTEQGRNIHGPDIWIKFLEKWIDLWTKKQRKIMPASKPSVYIITDCRFKNEAEWIKSKGGLLLRVVAVDRTFSRVMSESNGDIYTMNSINTHQSETDLDDMPFEFVIDNSIDSQDGVKASVHSILSNWYDNI